MTTFLRRLLLGVSISAVLPLSALAGVVGSLCSSVAFVPEAPAAYAAVAERGSYSGYYLDLADLDLRAVPAAPAEGSYEDDGDLRAVLDWQYRRTKEQCAAARAEMSHNYGVFFGQISPFPEPEPPAVKKFFKNVGKDSVAAHRFLKDVYQRERPFVRDPRIKPCLYRIKGYAYPSGHATMSRLFALILSDLVPSRRAEFIARADEAALNRLIGGVHHPTDLAAGRELADTLYKYLKKDPGFRSDLKALKPLLR